MGDGLCTHNDTPGAEQNASGNVDRSSVRQNPLTFPTLASFPPTFTHVECTAVDDTVHF